MTALVNGTTYGLSSNTMAPITSDVDATRSLRSGMALITSGQVKCNELLGEVGEDEIYVSLPPATPRTRVSLQLQ